MSLFPSLHIYLIHSSNSLIRLTFGYFSLNTCGDNYEIRAPSFLNQVRSEMGFYLYLLQKLTILKKTEPTPFPINGNLLLFIWDFPGQSTLIRLSRSMFRCFKCFTNAQHLTMRVPCICIL